jgi:hypothetical protein
MCKYIALKMIRAYQKTISPDHGFLSARHRHQGGFCRFTPTCSQYTYEAVDKYGVIKGSWLGIKRICRCNPWSKGGYDPVK